MSTLHMLIGPPASGKSTVVRALVEHGAVVVCPDDFREQYPEWSQNNETLFHNVHQHVRNTLLAGKDVTYDAMNIFPPHRRSLLAIGYRTNSPVISIQMNTPLEICLQRHDRRQKNRSQMSLTVEAITRLWQATQQNPPRLSEGFHQLISLQPDDDVAIALKLNPRPTSP